jgi:DNA-binding NarL/FixJ family response regulator
MQVVAEAGDVADAERLTRAHRPRVLVLELNMPGGSSLDAIPRLCERAARTAIVMLTMNDDPAVARQALQAGALGFVLRRPRTRSCWRPFASRLAARPTSIPGWALASPACRASRRGRRMTSRIARSRCCD